MYRTTTRTYQCGECEREFEITVFPEEKETRIDPHHPMEVEPETCSQCGCPVSLESVAQDIADEREAMIEADAESRREMAWERERERENDASPS